jgi:hypothetical protein
MTIGQGFDVGPFHFTFIRVLIASGLVRLILRRERPAGGLNGLDGLILAWASWAVMSSLFHKDIQGALVFRLGLVYNTCGTYFLLRVFASSLEDAKEMCVFTAILLVPVAIEMIYECVAFHNLFSVFGGVPEVPQIRNGKIRAFGPFAHPILAGAVGAACLPLMIGFWRQHRKVALAGIAACSVMIITSASSGPVIGAMAGVAALFMWHYRHRLRLLRWLAVIGYVGLELTMKAHAYYIIWRFDFAGGSTGFHRAALIDSALRHLDEWWLAGTDFTRHWMSTGVEWSPNHADITNEYIHMGVIGGLPLMLLFIGVLAKGFSFVGRTLEQASGLPDESRFMLWGVGSGLFSHALMFISVSYFDQSILFVYLTLAVIGSVYSGLVPPPTPDESEWI